jgi:hypothetical protein
LGTSHGSRSPEMVPTNIEYAGRRSRVSG